jgi:hypothetical protein
MRFDVAISFAGPERGLARSLAESLSADGFDVFFDEHFEHEMLGQDGADYLNRVFFQESGCCLAFVSTHYQQSAWAQLERRAAQARELHDGPGVIIPVLVDQERPPWLLPTRIYFNLAERGIGELHEVLRRRLLGEMGQLRQTIEDVFDGPGGKIASLPGGREFLAWSQPPVAGSAHVQRLRWDSLTGLWHRERTDIHERARWLFADGARLVAVPDRGDEPIHILDSQGVRSGSVLLNRAYRWEMITDCKCATGVLLLGFASGDVWMVDLTSLEPTELRQGGDDVEYTFPDFLGDGEILVARETPEVEIRSAQSGAVLARHDIPEPATEVWGFPVQDRVVIAGVYHLFFYRASDWTLLRSTSLQASGTFSACRSQGVPLLGLISGISLSANTLEVYDAMSGDRLVRVRSGWDRGWRSVAISADGKAVAAAADEAVSVFSRGGEPAP